MLNLAVFIPAFSPFIKTIGGTPFALGIMNSISAFLSLVWNPIVASIEKFVTNLVATIWAILGKFE